MAITVAMRTQVTQLYVSLFGRAPDAEGLGFWVKALDNGMSFANLAQQMYNTAPARAYYPEFATNQEIVRTFYQYVLGRPADDEGLAFWVRELEAAPSKGAFFTKILNNVVNYAGTDPAGLKSQAWFLNRVEVAQYYAEHDGDIAGATPVLDGVTDVDATVIAAKAMIDGEVAAGQTFMLTAGFDQFIGGNRGGALGDTYLGTAENGFVGNGTQSTFNPGDAIDGGTGSNTLRLFMGQGATADGVAVSNIQTLDLRLNANNGFYGDVYDRSNLVMTDWDASLEQINIRSNKSSIDIVDQQVIADVSISDQSTVNGAAYYGFNYAAGVVDGAADGLSVTLDNVNGTEGAGVYIDGGIEQLDLTVADRAGTVATPNRYASDVNLSAEGVTALTVDAGRAGQTFTLTANVADGADFDSTAFAGDMVLDSANIETATFGAGSDTATFSGVADSEDAAYNMGEGDNRLTLNVAFAGEALAGAGADTILANSTLDGSSISAGNGINRVTIAGEHAGAITTGTGADTVGVVSTAVTGTIDVGNGDNTVTAGAHAGDIDAGTGNDSITVTTTAAGSGIHAGSGNNTIVATAHAGEITTTDGNDSVTVASTAAGSSISVGDGTNTVAVTADHEGAIAAGNGKNTVSVGEDMLTGSSITVGNGNENLITVTGSVIDDADDTNKNTSIVVGSGNGNIIDINGYVYNSTITVGDGDNNSLDIAGSLSATAPGTVTFGDGDNNSITIGGSIISESVVVGTGTGAEIDVTGSMTTGSSIEVAGQATTLNVDGSIIGGSSVELGNGANVVTIGGNIDNASSVTLGNGANVATIEGDILAGSTVSFGSGADTLTLGSADNSALIKGTDVKSVVNMGGGNDSVTLLTEPNEDEPTTPYLNVLVQSAGLLDGQGGTDTLTVNAADQLETLYVIDRTQNQQVTIDFSGETFALNDKVKVTFTRGTETFYVEYTVSAADFIQGPDAVATKVAQSVAAKLSANGTYDAHFAAATAASGVVTIVSDNPHEDFAITATDGVVDVVQISDARINSFETLNLVALDGEDADYSTINANFDLIDGTHNVNLDSQVQLDPVVVNDNYDTFEQGGVTTFELDNLKGGEAISVSGYEATATGNRQVVTLTVDNDENDHVVGDKLTVIVDGVEMPAYVVTAADLVSDNAQDDANNIADSLAAHILAQLGNASGWTVKVEDNVIYLVGDTESTSDIGVKHTRVDSEFEIDLGTQTTWDVSEGLELLQAGDVITVTLGDQVETYTVTQEDCDRQQAEHISEYFAAQFDGATAGWGIVDLGEEADVVVTRVVENVIGQTTANNVQTATSTDDSETDVVIDAFLSDDAVNTTMDLTVAGEGDFDFIIRGDSGFTDLDLTLGDAHSHYIDTYGDEGNFAESITVTDAASVNTDGKSVTLDYVLAHTVTSTSAADLTIDQYVTRSGGEDSFGNVEDFADETITVSTGTGDDHLTTLAQSALNEGSRINLGTGTNRLSLGWGENYTASATRSVNWFTFDQLATKGLTADDVIIGDDNGYAGTDPFKGITLQDHYDNRSDNAWSPFIVSSIGDGATWTDLNTAPPSNMVVLQFDWNNTTQYFLLNSDFQLNWDEQLLQSWAAEFGTDPEALAEYLSLLDADPFYGIASPELEAIGGMDYIGDLTQLDILQDVQLTDEETTLTMPGGVDNVEVLTFTDLETTDENNVPSDLTVVGAANNFGIESGDDFELGVSVPAVVTIGGSPGTSNLTYDITASDDGATTPFTDALTNPSGNESAAYVEIGHRVKGATYVSGFTPGVVLPVPDTFSGTGDNAVDDEQMEVYYGTYDAATGIFTVTMTPNDSLPDPGNAPTHTLVLYDNDPVGQVAFAEGLVFPGFFEEDGWTLPDSPAPGQNFVTFDTNNGLYVPFDDGNAGGGDSGSGMDIGVLTVSGADGVEITGDLSVTVDDDVSFNLGNKQLTSLTVDAGDNVDVYVFGNADADIQIGSISMTSAGDEYLNLSILENTGTDMEIGSIELLATAGEDSAAPHLIVSGNTDTSLDTGNVTLQAGEGHGDQHDFGMDIEDNLRISVSMAAVALSSDYADATVSVSANTESTVSFETLDINSGCYAEVYVNDNVDSNITVSGNVNVAGENWANLEIDNNTGTNVSMAADGVVSLMSCDDDIDVSVSGNLNDYDPFEDGPDLGAQMAKTYSVTLGDLVLDAATDAYIDVSDNNDDTYFGDLTVTIGDVNVVAYDYAGFDIDDNLSATIVVGDVNMLSQSSAYVDIDDNDGRLYTTSWGNQEREEIDYADITLGDVTLESTDSYAWMDIDYNNQAAVSVGNVSLTAADYADFDVVNNDSSTGESLSEVTVNVESVTLVAETSSDFWIEYNDAEAGYNIASSDDSASIDITIGDVDMTAGTYAYFGIYDNNVDAGEDGSAEVNIEVADITLDAVESYFTIEDNTVYSEGDGNNNTAILNITLGAIDMTSGSDAVSNTGFEVEGTDVTAYEFGDASATVTIESVSIQSDNYTYVYIYSTDAEAYGDFATASSTVDIGFVDVTSENGAFVQIYDNNAYAGTEGFDFMNDASIDISVDAVTVTVGGEDDADFSIGSNDAVVYGFASDDNEATVNVDVVSVTLDAGEDASFDIDDNDAVVEFEDLGWGDQDDNNTSVDITVGDVEIDANQDANFDIDDNDAWVGSGYGEDNTTSVAIAVDAVTMTAGQDANFAIDDNDAFVGGEDWFNSVSVDIEVADVSMDASDDVSFVIENNVADDFAPNIDYGNSATVNVTTGEVTIDAGDDVYYFVDGTVSTSVTQGDVTITAGLDKATAEIDEDVSSDVYFHFVEVEGTANISIEAQSNANGEGNIYGYVEDAYDLETLTLTGSNAELYLVDDIGVHNETGLFTLDLTGMTGSFSEGASFYDPLGDNVENNAGQDNGVYVQTWDADFGGNDVTVKIGASDVIYNAQSSYFLGSSSDFQYDWYYGGEDWNGDEGWFSLGDNLDLIPTIASQTFTIGAFSGDPTGGSDNRYSASATILDTGEREFAAVIDYWWDDSDGDRGWYYYNGDSTIDWYELVGSSWVGVSVYEVEDAFGPDVEITVNSSDFQGEWYIEETYVTITGAADGSDFDFIETAVQDWGYDGDAVYEALVDGAYSSDFDTTEGIRATDGLGNIASETFEFDAGGIGEVVIGGFRPNGFFAQSEVDRLDFSAFADIDSAADLIITIDDNDGYFDDVIIDFVNDDYGVVRLVGVGEYFTDLNVNGIANSIIFA
jgi:hypothetical protein